MPFRSAIPRDPAYLPSLDGIRALAALVVLFHHIWLQAGLGFYLFGHFAVGLFITLSGYCLMLPVVRAGLTLKGGAATFFRRRARRILFPYYAAVALTLVLTWGMPYLTWMTPRESTGARQIVANLLLVQDAVPEGWFPLNHPLWTISVEWRIYFFFPVLVALWQRWGGVRATLITAAGAVALVPLLSRTSLNTTMHGVSPHFLALFAFGAFAAGVAWAEDGLLAAVRERFAWGAATAALSVALLALAKLKPWPLPITDLFVGLWALCLLVGLTTGRFVWIDRVVSSRPLTAIGRFSFSLYLIHMPLVHLLWFGLVREWCRTTAQGFLLLSAIGAPTIVAAAYGFFFLAERPFLKARRDRTAVVG